MWEPLIELVQSRKNDISFRWVKGHSGDPMNDLVDRLAVEAADTQKGRSGDEPPTELGPADDVGKSRSKAKKAASPAPGVPPQPEIPGRPLVVLGHKPTELGGYDDDALPDAVRERLQRIIEAKAAIFADLVVVSGLRLGAEMLGAEAALAAGVPLVAVLPYPDPQSVWPAASQERFQVLLDAARDVITLQKRRPESKQQAGAALARRDAWLARNATEAVLVWDGKDPALGRLFRSLEDHLGEDVWVLDPNELTVPRSGSTA